MKNVFLKKTSNRTGNHDGQASFSAQYLQTPILEENNGLNRDHFGWYNPNEIDLTGARVVHCWDTAVTAKETNDLQPFLQ